MKKINVKSNRDGIWIATLLASILIVLFWRSFLPGYVHFSNDVPLGQQNAEWLQLPAAMTGMWADQGGLGGNAGALTPGISMLMRFLLSPVLLAKFFPLLALFIAGMGAWTFFRALKLSPLAATLGALAAMLNSTFFTSACWGVATQQIALGMDFFALALILANTNETRWLIRWARLALAGLCVGLNVIEAADIGALFSIFVAAFVFYKALVEAKGNLLTKSARGIGQVAVIALFAGFVAIQTVTSLVGTQIQGVAGTAQDPETKLKQWDFATQWSVPKKETLALVVPGLFGYKMDTPNNMLPAAQVAYRGGNYWGGVGRAPALDRMIDQGINPEGSSGFRFIGSGSYCGILVTLIGAWAVMQSFRRQNSPFADMQKKNIWFWAAVLVASLLFSWGRFAPFYALLYQLPYFSTIRNPVKFLHFLSWALTILFAYGIHALGRQLDPSAPKTAGWSTQLKIWWARAGQFDRRWIFACVGLLGASIVGWLIFAAQQPSFVQYLQKMGFPDEKLAHQIAAFSLGSAGWFLLLFAVAILLLTLVIAGYFAGPRAKTGALLLGIFLVFDLVRADLPYVTHWDYLQKYEIGTLNSVVDFLRTRPYEHRVAKLLSPPLSTPSQFEGFSQLYDIEWLQHHFPYYNIQSLDVWQMPREPEDWKAYQTALQIGIKQDASGQWILDQATFPQLTRKWELTNTRYLLGPAPFLDLFNNQFDPEKKRFRILQRFSIALKPGVTEFHQKLEEVTVYPNDNGEYALFDFTGALPRAKLYTNWQTNSSDAVKNFTTNGLSATDLLIFNNAGTNGFLTLKKLASPSFDPQRTVLLDPPLPSGLPNSSTNENPGTVEFKSYAPKHIVFTANATVPSILLLNDKYDPHWVVTVDGKPAELLRCNFIMRGVQLSAGQHTVEFSFILPNKPLYITLSAMGFGILLWGFLIVSARRKNSQTL